MALVIAYLGERLRKISKQSHLSIASLSAYLNEVIFFFFGFSVLQFHECHKFLSCLCKCSKLLPRSRCPLLLYRSY